MVDFAALATMAVFIFGGPLKGGLAARAVSALIYLTATAYGLLISNFATTRSPHCSARRSWRAAGSAVLWDADAGFDADRFPTLMERLFPMTIFCLSPSRFG